ncbi:MAG: sugar transferase [Peptostreptococcaceae bacterium]|nr:sugar transferase [Peptostreptococcaceae bacterium]
MYSHFFKRPFDIICSLLALIVLFPVLLVTAILVRIKIGYPVIFRQKRPGLNEKIFTLYKFRTMTDKKDEKGNLLSDVERLTKFGKKLRSTSIDELLELFNILKGDMSIVGPRPLLEKYLPYYTPEERVRHSVRPGLTGLAQVNGRNFLDWNQRLAMDIRYVKTISLMVDIRIIINTVVRVVKRSDVAEKRIMPLDLERSMRKEE